MKKLFAICLTVIAVSIIFTMTVSVSAAPRNWIISPTAPTYYETTHEEENHNKTNYFTTHNPYWTGSNSEDPLPTHPWTGSFTNNGKDDPNSPNYTGDVSVSKDNSHKSPDTAAGPSAAPVAVAVLTLIGVLGFSGKALSKKKEN